MMFLNECEVDEYLRMFGGDQPNLQQAAEALNRLMWWADANSDGWAYWPKPARSAKKLQTLLYGKDAYSPDVTDAELKAALSPVKAFLTRHGVSHEEVLS